ncbi:MAG: membrane or secreted protein [Candidatus Cyclobacteriaceae bacterium M2_1C_046]
MKLLYPFIFTVFLFSCGQNQSAEQEEQKQEDPKDLSLEQLSGAWETTYTNEQGITIRIVNIISDGYISTAGYNEDQKLFDGTSGGSIRIEGNNLHKSYEYNTVDTTQLGQTVVQEFELRGDTLIFPEQNITWTRIDDGKPGALAGAWLITGRKRDGEINRREPGARKTMKILSGTRFQWIAYNSETGDFFGTGGGTYTTDDSTYTENIEFFSRDSSRVGASLEFTYELKDGEWHHSGLSSKGEPIYEIWTRRTDLEK